MPAQHCPQATDSMASEHHKDLANARSLWLDLGNVLVDQDGRLQEPFLHFAVGTERFKVWQWFESHFQCSIVEDLMFRFG